MGNMDKSRNLSDLVPKICKKCTELNKKTKRIQEKHKLDSIKISAEYIIIKN